MMNIKDCAFILVDLQEKLLPHILEHEAVVNNCIWLNKLVQRLNVPMLVVEQYPKGLLRTHHEILSTLVQSIVIEKVHFSAGRNVEFIDKLAALNKTSVVLCGIEAHVCVLQTALDLQKLDYKVFVVADAIGSRNADDKRYAIERMYQAGISIVTKEMVLFEWLEHSGTDLFKHISKEFLK